MCSVCPLRSLGKSVDTQATLPFRELLLRSYCAAGRPIVLLMLA